MTGLPYFGAERLFARARSTRGLKIGKNLRLVKLADSPDFQGNELKWSTPDFHDRFGGTTTQWAWEHPWIGKPGFGIRYHETIIVGIHPDETWTVAHEGHETMSTAKHISTFAPGSIHVVARHRGSEKPSTLGPDFPYPHADYYDLPYNTPERDAAEARHDRQVERWQARLRRTGRWYFPDDKRIVLDVTGKPIEALWTGSAGTRWRPGQAVGPAPMPERVKKGRGRRVVEAFVGGPR
jgi:hypothetical protein